MVIVLAEVVITLALIGLAKRLQDVLTVFDDDHELFKEDNPALGIAKAGYYLSVMVALSGLWIGSGTGDWLEVRNFIVYGLLTLVLINISTLSVEYCILRNYKVYDLICGRRNEAVGWALAGSYLGSAFILRGAISGDDIGLYWSVFEILVYYGLGQLALMVAGELFERFHPSHHHALEVGNSAGGLSFAGFLMAIGMIIGGMSKGTLHLNGPDLLLFAEYSLGAIASLLVIRHYALPWLLSGGHCLKEEIYADHNKAAGFILAFSTLGVAQLLLVIWWSLAG